MKAMNKQETKEFLKAVSTMLSELSSALEYYADEERNPSLAAENKELLKRSKAMEEHFDDVILSISMSQLNP